MLTCCQHFFPPMLKAAVKVLNDDRCGPNNSLVRPSEIAKTGVGFFESFYPWTTSARRASSVMAVTSRVTTVGVGLRNQFFAVERGTPFWIASSMLPLEWTNPRSL